MGILSNDTWHVQEVQADHRVLRCEFLEALDERGIAVEFSLRLEDHPIGLEAHQVPHVSDQGPAVLALLLNDASRDVGQGLNKIDHKVRILMLCLYLIA